MHLQICCQYIRLTPNRLAFSRADGVFHKPAGFAKNELRMWPTVLLVIYATCITAASFAGGWLPSMLRLTHDRMQFVVSFVAGLMLGVALFHLLPHAAHETGSLDRAIWWTMIGLLTTFFLVRAFHFHQHGPAESSDEPARFAQGHDHDCPGHHAQELATLELNPLSWVGVTLGLGIHTFIDGVALAASVAADAEDHADGRLLGLGTFLAVLLHKPLDAMSITSLMQVGRWSRLWMRLVNAAFALICPIGAAVFYLGVRYGGLAASAVGCAVAFAAGVFLCISLGDLLPEVQFHRHDRFKLSALLLLGVALAWGIGFLEPDHAHDLPAAPAAHEHGAR